MSNKLSIVLIIILTVGILANCKSEVVQPSIQDIWVGCPEKYDSTATLKKMVGEWKQIATGGVWNNIGIKATEGNIKIIITDQTIEAFVENVSANKVKYVIAKSYNEGYFFLKTDPAAKDQYIWGIVEFCNDKIAFKNSYVDGSDYYFQRIK